MTDYRVLLARSARKELESLPDETADRILKALAALARDPHPTRARKLRGSEDLRRIRVGDYRIVYALDDPEREVHVLVIRHRRDAYR